MLFQQFVHPFKCRPEVCSAISIQFQMFHIVFHFFPGGNPFICVDFLITLNDMHIYFCKKALTLTKYTVGFLQKLSHQFSRTGHGGVDDDHELLYLLNFFGFQWFDQRHISIETQTIGIEIVIKTVIIHCQFFMKNCKFPQEFSVIIPASVLCFYLLQEISVPLTCLLRKGFQVCLDSIIDLSPFAAEHGIRFLIRFLTFPVSVIICAKFLFQICKILFVQIPF